MGSGLEIPKGEKVKSAREAIKILSDLDDQIAKVSELTEKEKAEIKVLLNEFYKLTYSFGYYPESLKLIIDDLKNDLDQIEGEFKIEDKRREVLEEEQRPPEYSIKFNKESANSTEIPEELNLIYIQVVHNRAVKPIILSKDQLKQNPSLKINGYIANIMIFSTKKMDVSIAGMSATTARFDGENSFMLTGANSVYFEDLATPEHPENELKELFLAGQKIEPGKPAVGRYFFMNPPLNPYFEGFSIPHKTSQTPLQLQIDGENYEIPIEQNTEETLETIDGFEFSYLGNNKEEFSKTDGVNEKLKAIVKSAKEIETIFGGKLIPKIHLIDFNGDNIYVSYAQSGVIFFTNIIENRSPEYLATATRHELLHQYAQARGYNGSEKIRAKFADIQGIKGEKREGVIKLGWVPRTIDEKINLQNTLQNKEFFNFINESNYFDVQDAGHSQDNVNEFVASFFHSIMHIDLLEKNLNKPIVVGSKTIELSKEQKLKILDIYIEVLKVIIEEVPTVPVPLFGPLISPLVTPSEWKEKNFLADKLEYIKELRKKIAETNP